MHTNKGTLNHSNIVLGADSFIAQVMFDCDYFGGPIVFKLKAQIEDYIDENIKDKERISHEELINICELLIGKLPKRDQLIIDYGHGIIKTEKGYSTDRRLAAEFIISVYQQYK